MEEEVRKLLRRPARLAAPGLLGTRLEHLGASAADGDTTARSFVALIEVATWAANFIDETRAS